VTLIHSHSSTARYRGWLDERAFDLYLPLFMLDDGKADLPALLGVTMDRSRTSVRNSGLRESWRSLAGEPGVCE